LLGLDVGTDGPATITEQDEEETKDHDELSTRRKLGSEKSAKRQKTVIFDEERAEERYSSRHVGSLTKHRSLNFRQSVLSQRTSQTAQTQYTKNYEQRRPDIQLLIECKHPQMIPFVRYVLGKAQKYSLDVHILLECIKNSTESELVSRYAQVKDFLARSVKGFEQPIIGIDVIIKKREN
jgi:hypothetical protein